MFWRLLVICISLFISLQTNNIVAAGPLPDVINYGGNIAFYPFEFLDKNDTPKGFIIDLLKEIERRTGRKINIKLAPWEDIKNNLMNGTRYDLTSLYYSSERDQYMDFTSPLMITYDGLFIRKNTQKLANINDIVDKKVLVEQGGFIYEYLKKNLPQINVIPVNTEIEALQLINNGQYDAAIVNFYSGTANITRYKLNNIFSESIPLFAREYGFAVKSGNQNLLNIINSTLQSIKSDGTYADIYNKWFVTNDDAVKYQNYLMWAGLILLLLSTIAGLIFIWNRTLTSEVVKKTKELTAELEKRILAEKALISAKEETEKMSRIKTDFISQISHEIRTPVNVIIGSFELINEELQGDLDQEIKLCLDSASNAATRLIRTIDLMINFSDVQTGTYIPNVKTLDFEKDILDLLIREFKMEANIKGLVISKEVKTNNTVVKVDEYSIKEVFANLIDNAIKFTDKGEIKITLEEKESKFIVKVKDTGHGISEDYLSSLFQPFTQEQQGYTRTFDGNGLGLSLANKFCKLNNADIIVNSRKGTGSEFSVIFN